MTDGLIHIVVALNAIANALGSLLCWIGLMPGWLSATLGAVAAGVGMLVVFKFTSNQRAIRQTRRGIRANLLTVKLFKNSMRVGLRAQGLVLLGAARLLLLAIVPILLMSIPVLLLLGQIALWYQAGPIAVGDEAVVTVKLADDANAAWPKVEMMPTDAVDDMTGPVRVFSQREICWNVQVRTAGLHRLAFRVDGQTFEKEIAVGDGFMRVSSRRPAWDWSDTLRNPREKPFDPESPVQSIEVEYPSRSSWTSGTNSWAVYWFVVSLVAAICLRKALKVSL